MLHDKPTENGYNRRKLWEKQVKGSEYPRSYYKCTHQNCPVKKRVERNLDGLVTEIIYRAPHNNQPPGSGYASVETSGQLQPENFKGQTSDFNHSRVNASSIKDDQRSGSRDDEEVGDDSRLVAMGRKTSEMREPGGRRDRVSEISLLRTNDPTVLASITPYVSENWEFSLCVDCFFSHVDCARMEMEKDVDGNRKMKLSLGFSTVSINWAAGQVASLPPLPTSTGGCHKPTEDGYNWRKYGQKQVKGSEYPRSYYKCTHQNCPVKKKVERNLDGFVTEIIYQGQHNHQPPRSGYAGVGTSGQLQPENFEGQSGNFNHSRVDASSIMKDDQLSGSSDSEEAGDDVTVPRSKRRNVEAEAFDPVSSHRTITEPPIVIQVTSEIDLLDDGYKWSYYKCASEGCKVRKHVERAASDPKDVITTYEGKHNHLVPTVRNNNHDTTRETASQLRPHGPVGHLRLKDEHT
ncbi:hypothetical protein L6452_21113 [Arctium lappa]|uniref:Uncharacterized protein n=1 Tax=Arctium lappa TaxID=4217 RepID=A0ACB9BDB0_ARCLA|nr:hypothetical protein L6452_21113 [Arctium lappa]